MLVGTNLKCALQISELPEEMGRELAKYLIINKAALKRNGGGKGEVAMKKGGAENNTRRNGIHKEGIP